LLLCKPRFLRSGSAQLATAARDDCERSLFGWTVITEYANGGQFIRLQSDGQGVGSIYTLNHRERTAKCHIEHPMFGWECRHSNAQVDEAGGVVFVRSFGAYGIARIALVAWFHL